MLVLMLGSCTDSPSSATTSTAAVADETSDGSSAGTASGQASTSVRETTASSEPPAQEETTTASTTTTTTIPPTTTTTIPLVTEGAIVLVANATEIDGAAGQLTAALQAVGFAMKEPTNAAGYEESLAASKIYFLPQAEAAAQSLALVMQINSVSRMPTPAPIDEAQVGLGDATVLIMLGADLAGNEIPGLAGR